MKTCTKSGSTKTLEDFHRHSSAKDGRMSSCIACDKDRCREYRSRNIDRIREYDRKRSALPHRREARLNYRFTDNFRASHNETTRRYVKDNPAKRAAHVAAGSFVVRGPEVIGKPVVETRFTPMREC